MPRTTSITLGDQLDEFVSCLLKSGRYSSTSEIVRSALRLLEQEERQTDLLRRELDKGEQSGESVLSLQDIACQTKHRLHV